MKRRKKEQRIKSLHCGKIWEESKNINCKPTVKTTHQKILPRFHIMVQEYLIQEDVMDDVEQNTIDLMGKGNGKGQNRRCHWSRFRLTPTRLKNASGDAGASEMTKMRRMSLKW